MGGRSLTLNGCGGSTTTSGDGGCHDDGRLANLAAPFLVSNGANFIGARGARGVRGVCGEEPSDDGVGLALVLAP